MGKTKDRKKRGGEVTPPESRDKALAEVGEMKLELTYASELVAEAAANEKKRNEEGTKEPKTAKLKESTPQRAQRSEASGSANSLGG